MAKAYKEKVEVQKGPINLDEQYSYKFMGRPHCMMEDIVNAELRRSAKTMDLHEPKK